MVDMFFTKEAKEALMRGELLAEEVIEETIFDGEQIAFAGSAFPFINSEQVAKGTFKIDYIEYTRMQSDMVEITLFLAGGMPLLKITAELEIGEKLTLAKMDMRVTMNLT